MECKEEMDEDDAGVTAESSRCSVPVEFSSLPSSSCEANEPSIQLAKMADMRCMTPLTVLLLTSSGCASGPVSDQSPLSRKRFIGGIPLLPLPFPLPSDGADSATNLGGAFGTAEAQHFTVFLIPVAHFLLL